MPKRNEREYRSMNGMICRSADEGSYVVEGYATTFNDPYLLYEFGGEKVFECVDRKAFDGCDMSDVIFQYDHAGMVYARTRNGSLKLEIDEHGLKVTADLGLTEESRKVYEAIQNGLIDRMSFAFTVDEDKWDEKTRTSTITRIGKLFDVSAVSIPANPNTEISAERKALLDGEIERVRTERCEREARLKKIRLLKLKIKVQEARKE